MNKIDEWIKKNEDYWWETRHLGSGDDLLKAISIIKIMKEALEKYANKDNFWAYDDAGYISECSLGFETAREALAQVEKEIS